MTTALSNLLALLSLDESAYLKGLTSSQAATASFADNLANMGGAIVVGGLSMAAAAIAAVGVAAWEAGNTMDGAMDTIATATGATGPALEGLGNDFKAVFTSVPADAQSTADAIGILNSRLDVSGPALQNLASPLLEVSRILGTDVKQNAEDFTRVMGDWSLPVEDASTSLDALFVAAQQTGAPLGTLMQQVVQYGAPMRNFGFSFEQAGGLLASFAAQGVNTEIVMSGLRTAQGKFISSGVDMSTGLWNAIDAIQNAETSTEALGIATETFGAKAAADWFDTIRGGKFDLDTLVGAMQNADGTIMSTAASTADWGEMWQVLKNRATVALAPLGAKLMEGVGSAIGQLGSIMERPDVQKAFTAFADFAVVAIGKVVDFIPVLIDSLFSFVSFLQNNQGIVIGILAALGVAAIAWGVSTATAAWAVLAPLLPIVAVMAAIGAVAYLVYQAWTNNWGGIRDILTQVWENNLKPAFETLVAWLQTNIPLAIQALTAFWYGTFLPAMQAVWTFLQTYIIPLLQAIGEVIWASLVYAFEFLSALITTKIIPALEKFGKFIQEKVMPVVTTFGNWLNEKLAPAFEWISDAIKSVVSWLRDLANQIDNLQLPDWLTPGSPTPFEMGLWGINDALTAINRNGLPTFQAGLQLQPVGISPMSLPSEYGTTAQAPENGGFTNYGEIHIHVDDGRSVADILAELRV